MHGVGFPFKLVMSFSSMFNSLIFLIFQDCRRPSSPLSSDLFVSVPRMSGVVISGLCFSERSP